MKQTTTKAWNVELNKIKSIREVTQAFSTQE